uniref:Uncharacterized protein n=1 Tax=Anguilla anguilla TaxID=7936 RepID=A0A0E9X377_ANGAN
MGKDIWPQERFFLFDFFFGRGNVFHNLLVFGFETYAVYTSLMFYMYRGTLVNNVISK